MRLVITLEKEFNNEANMRSSRDAVEAKALEAGYLSHWIVSE